MNVGSRMVRSSFMISSLFTIHNSAFTLHPLTFSLYAVHLQSLRHRLADQRRACGHLDSRGFERGDLVGCRTLASGNDGARVSHATARRSGAPGDEPDDRL